MIQPGVRVNVSSNGSTCVVRNGKHMQRQRENSEKKSAGDKAKTKLEYIGRNPQKYAITFQCGLI